MENLLIGNLISAVAAIFTAKSSWAKDRWHIYFYQVVQCLLLALASVFFNSYAGIVSLLVCAFRNYMAAIGKLNKTITLICFALVVIPGIALNNRGYIGWIILLANTLYTIGMYVCQRELTIKLNIILNLFLWTVYEILILDIPSVIADVIGLGVAVLSLFRKEQTENRDTKSKEEREA